MIAIFRDEISARPVGTDLTLVFLCKYVNLRKPINSEAATGGVFYKNKLLLRILQYSQKIPVLE